MIALFFSLGIFVGLVFYELTGLTPGGIIVPGYIALYAHQPLRILGTLLAGLITLALGKLFLRWTIAYGRIRYGIFLLIGIGVQVIINYLLFNVGRFPLEIHSIGLIIPGIIANDMERQGIGLTLLSLGIVSLFIYLIIISLPQGFLL
jgi:poly-gamma-glutamate biosynthesis protein PgsC/CapC